MQKAAEVWKDTAPHVEAPVSSQAWAAPASVRSLLHNAAPHDLHISRPSNKGRDNS